MSKKTVDMPQIEMLFSLNRFTHNMDNSRIFEVILILVVFFENTRAATDFQTDVKSLRSNLLNLIELKNKFRLPYIKFGYTFKRVVICGLSRSQKLALCDCILGNKPFNFEFSSNTYPFLSCRRITLPMLRLPKVSAFKCPTPHRMLGKDMHVPIHSPISYYFSGAVNPVKAFMYYNYTGGRQGIVPYLLIRGLTSVNFQDIVHNIERSQSYIMSSTARTSLHHDVTPYYVQEWTSSVIRAPPYAETQATHLSQNVLKNNRPYSKFMVTFKSVSICGLGSSSSRQICGHAFDGNEYNYNSETLSNVRMKCMKLPISSVYSYSRPTLTSVLYCGDAQVNQNKIKAFFMSTSIEENSVLIYARYYPHNEILPEGLISNIDLKAFQEPFQVSNEFLEIIAKPRFKRKFQPSILDAPLRKKRQTTP